MTDELKQWEYDRGYDEGYEKGKAYMMKKIEDIKDDIAKYQADCRLIDDSKECKRCDEMVFSTILGIIYKHIRKEQE